MAHVRLLSRGEEDILLQAIHIVFGSLLLPRVYPILRHAASTHKKQLCLEGVGMKVLGRQSLG